MKVLLHPHSKVTVDRKEVDEIKYKHIAEIQIQGGSYLEGTVEINENSGSQIWLHSRITYLMLFRPFISTQLS